MYRNTMKANGMAESGGKDLKAAVLAVGGIVNHSVKYGRMNTKSYRSRNTPRETMFLKILFLKRAKTHV